MTRWLIGAALAVLTLAAAPAVAHARVPEGFFGVMYDREVTRASAGNQEDQWAFMGRSGVESLRTVFRWADAQPEAGQPFDFERTDRLVGFGAMNNINLLPVVLGSPGWAATPPEAYGSPPANVADYTAYLRALVLRYGPGGTYWAAHPEMPPKPLREWQIWNEPHLEYYWNTSGRRRNAWAPEYARLLRASKAAIEAIDPGATIVLAGLADYAWKHLSRLYRHGVRGQFDVATFNLFTSRPLKVLTGMKLFRRSLRRGGERRKPIWLTETTWPAAKGRVPVPRPAWQRAWYTSDLGMTRRLRAMYVLAIRNRKRFRLHRLYWYTWASAYRDGDLFDYSGLVRYAGGDFEPRPALQVYSAIVRRYRR